MAPQKNRIRHVIDADPGSIAHGWRVGQRHTPEGHLMGYDSNKAKLLQSALKAAQDVVSCLETANNAIEGANLASGALFLCADERGKWDMTPFSGPLEKFLKDATARRDDLDKQWTAACQETP